MAWWFGAFLLVGVQGVRAQPTGGIPKVDVAAADRGGMIYAGSCASCHGPTGRGTKTAPDLLRSLVVLHDRFNQLDGKEMAATLKTGPHHYDFNAGQLKDISQFLSLSIYKILRSGYSNQPVNLLTGSAKDGEAYFNGAGGCTKCHSITGDLAGVGSRYPIAALQQKLLFPNSGIGRGPAGAPAAKKTQVTVTLPSGASVSGSLVRIDDFNVTLSETSGQPQTISRTAGTKVVLTDPYAGHIALLDKYTDADIHNLLAYLVTLK